MIKRDLRQSFLHCFHFTESNLIITVTHKGKHRAPASFLLFYRMPRSCCITRCLKAYFCFLKYKGDQVLFNTNWKVMEMLNVSQVLFSHNCCCSAFEAYWIYFCYACYKLEDSILCSVSPIAQQWEFCLGKYKAIIYGQFVVAFHLFMHSHMHRRH